MKIYKNDFNTLPMQVEENMKNIELLASIIKEAYRSNVDLLDTDVSVAISDTNADATTIDGWLIDPIGKIFKITSGDGTNLLIEFYSDIRGEKGDQGDQGEQGADGQNGQDGARGYGIHYTSDNFDPNVSIYNIANVSTNTPIVKDDVMAFKNGYLAIITNVTEYQIYVNLLNYVQLEIGKKTYQHNIQWRVSSIYYYATITNDNNTPFTQDTFFAWLVSKGFTDANNKDYNLCYSIGTTQTHAIRDNGTSFSCRNSSGGGNGQFKADILGFTDTPIEL